MSTSTAGCRDPMRSRRQRRRQGAKTGMKTPGKTSGTEALSFDAGDGRTVSALLDLPKGARALLVVGHGAGAGMRHPFLATMAELLAARGIGTLRYQFPYMEAGKGSV